MLKKPNPKLPVDSRYYAFCAEQETEYRTLLTDRAGGIEEDDDKIRALLQKDEWCEEGATAILMLARQYGAFILRNALALARTLSIEDGELNL